VLDPLEWLRARPYNHDGNSNPAIAGGGPATRERSLLVGVVTPKTDRPEVEESLAELERLVDTFGADTAERVIQVREEFSPAYLIGKGKAHEIAKAVKRKKLDFVVFDDDLTPVQQRNLETAIGRPVIDRCGLILEIFGQHARTYEAKLQVELAKNRYLLPRLTHAWTHFSRQRGGGSIVRGAGETQLEVDRRMVRHRISALKRKLAQVSRQRATRRKGREAAFRVALVGYTNSGKSTLMNALTDSNVIAEDRLFATLDSTVRTIRSAAMPRILLTDTVGFIRKLPHSLVASFKSTLEEVQDADLLLEVVDLSDPGWEKKMEATEEVLSELDLELEDKPRLIVFNKLDLLPPKSKLPAMARSVYPDSVAVSASSGEGLDALRASILQHFSAGWEARSLSLAYDQADLVRQLRQIVHVEKVDYQPDGIKVHFRAPDSEFRRIERRISEGSQRLAVPRRHHRN
jgi:GTP-binding protein HflX